MAGALRPRPPVVRALVLGAGAVGARVGRQLSSTASVESLVVVDQLEDRAQSLAESIGPRAEWRRWSEDLLKGCDVVVLAVPRDVRSLAESALERGVDGVSVGGQEGDVGGGVRRGAGEGERA